MLINVVEGLNLLQKSSDVANANNGASDASEANLQVCCLSCTLRSVY